MNFAEYARNVFTGSFLYFTYFKLSGDTFIRTFNAIMELLTERYFLEMLENMIRGSVSSLFLYDVAKANNAYLETFNPKRPHVMNVGLLE